MKNFYKFLVAHKIALYPAVLLITLVILSSFAVSGTSIGSYHDVLYGENSKDNNLIAGSPRDIRSDEWLVITQMAIAQKENNFAQVNNNFNGGQDMSLLADAPYWEWSVLFKPQNLGFLVLPFENAFAFKWWFLLIALALSTYYLSLRLVPNKLIFAIGISAIATLSPFVFWWYQSSTALSIAYGMIIITLSLALIDGKQLTIFRKRTSPRLSTILKTTALVYTLVAFALLMYPPFLIPIALVVAFFVLGYLIKACIGKPKKNIINLLAPFIVSVTVAGGICGAFLVTRAEVVGAVANTAYPGARSVPAGGYDVKTLLVSYLQPQLINDDDQNNYYSNQSEASNFILLPLFFIGPLLYMIFFLRRKKKKIEWTAIGIITPTLILFAHLFIPYTDIISKLFFLSTVPIERAIIGLGFAAILMVMLIARIYQYEIKLSKKSLIAIVLYSMAFLVLCIASGLIVREMYPNFITSRKLLVLYACIVNLGMMLILMNRVRLGVFILALFSLYSVYQIHPLYHGLGPIYNGTLTSAVKDVSKESDIWGVADDMRFENLPQLSDRKAVTGVAFYPNLEFWDRYSGTRNQAIYNRYAHIVLDNKTKEPILLVQKDVFVASTRCDLSLSQQLDFILSVSPIEDSCFRYIKQIKYPEQTFYIYKVVH